MPTYFLWPISTWANGSADKRAIYFGSRLKDTALESLGRFSPDKQAINLFELLAIRAIHGKILRSYSLGTAVGFRIRQGVLTDIPAILVFVARKIHRHWLTCGQCVPSYLEGPGGVWCDVDVVEFSYYDASAPSPQELLHSELVDGLRGSDLFIGSGSQVASQDKYGTLTGIVKSTTGNREVGFLTNRHVVVDLDYPRQKMFYPLPPNLGPGMYLGSVLRATSYIEDINWYRIYAGTNPESYVRADGAFIPFDEEFNVSLLTTSVKGLGEIGKVKRVRLHDPIDSIIGKQVMKVGRSSGLTTGTLLAYALEYNDDKGVSFFTDFLIVGENKRTFDFEGDSGSLILLSGENNEKLRPFGVIWGGTTDRGRVKIKNGEGPQNWTSGVDLWRLLHTLELDLITSSEDLQEALEDQRNAPSTADVPAIVESSFTDGAAAKIEEMTKPHDRHFQFSLMAATTEQSITPDHVTLPQMDACSEDYLCTALQLGERESKRKKSDLGERYLQIP